jgi:hypothetical protein
MKKVLLLAVGLLLTACSQDITEDGKELQQSVQEEQQEEQQAEQQEEEMIQVDSHGEDPETLLLAIQEVELKMNEDLEKAEWHFQKYPTNNELRFEQEDREAMGVTKELHWAEKVYTYEEFESFFAHSIEMQDYLKAVHEEVRKLGVAIENPRDDQEWRDHLRASVEGIELANSYIYDNNPDAAPDPYAHATRLSVYLADLMYVPVNDLLAILDEMDEEGLTLKEAYDRHEPAFTQHIDSIDNIDDKFEQIFYVYNKLSRMLNDRASDEFGQNFFMSQSYTN